LSSPSSPVIPSFIDACSAPVFSPLSLSNSPLSIRSFSVSPRVAEEERDPAYAPEELTEEVDPTTPFANLEGKVHPATLEALTVRPFKFVNMSTVQDRVLNLLPGLAGREEGFGPGEKGRRDLLVKVSPAFRSASSTLASLVLIASCSSTFQARTGTGKTLAFLTPALESRLRHLAENNNPQEYARTVAGTLIITPTRELAVQIANEARLLTSGHPGGFGVHLFVGGDSKRDSLRKWDSQRKDFVVATPGRLKDMLQSVRSVSTAMSALETVSPRSIASFLFLCRARRRRSLSRCRVVSRTRHLHLL
jgi:ATP-dependent RNA helicase MSS116